VLGRQYTGAFYSMLAADIVGPHLFGTGALDAYIPNARVDNALGYQHKLGSLQFGGTFSLGRDVSSSGGPAATNCAGELAADKKACREWSVFSRYETPQWGVAAAYDKTYGGKGVVFEGPSALNDSHFYDARTILNGYAVLGTARVGLGWIGRKNVSSAPYKQDLVFLGASFPDGPLLYDAQIYRYTRRHSPDDTWMGVARVTYSFSKSTAVYASVGYLVNQGMAANSLDGVSGAGAGLNQKGFAAGIRKSF
jgi:predicted porin